jgi:hypothetical protein
VQIATSLPNNGQPGSERRIDYNVEMLYPAVFHAVIHVHVVEGLHHDAHGVESGVMNLLEIFGFETRLGRIGPARILGQDVDPAPHLGNLREGVDADKGIGGHRRRRIRAALGELGAAGYGECRNQQTSKRAKARCGGWCHG